MRSNFLISRRTCLQGLGVSLALPLLETMAPTPASGYPYPEAHPTYSLFVNNPANRDATKTEREAE